MKQTEAARVHPVRVGWCSRREGDDYGPDDHDGSNLHARRESCENWTDRP